jgi:hypothetical protein
MTKPFRKLSQVLQWEENMEAQKIRIHSLDLGLITLITTSNQVLRLVHLIDKIIS